MLFLIYISIYKLLIFIAVNYFYHHFTYVYTGNSEFSVANISDAPITISWQRDSPQCLMLSTKLFLI